MMILISGPSGSGKSRFAERLICRLAKQRLYIATMICQTEENQKRIERHKAQRAAFAFETLEEPYTLINVPVKPDSGILLEDVSNLLANCIFDRHLTMESVQQEIDALARRCRVLAVVTITGLRPEDYTGETAAYIRSLNTLNQHLFESADVVFQMEQGHAHCRKGAAFHEAQSLLDRPFHI